MHIPLSIHTVCESCIQEGMWFLWISLSISSSACVGQLCGKNSPLTLSMLQLFTWGSSKCMPVSTVRSAARTQLDDIVCAVTMDFIVNKGYFSHGLDTITTSSIIKNNLYHPVFHWKQAQMLVKYIGAAVEWVSRSTFDSLWSAFDCTVIPFLNLLGWVESGC